MVIGSDASSSKQALTMDGRAATSNLLNVTSIEKALLCQSLRALPDYPVRACLRTREKPTSHNALHTTISAQAMPSDGFALAPPPETIWLAPSTFTVATGMGTLPAAQKHPPQAVGDRPRPDLPYLSGGDQKKISRQLVVSMPASARQEKVREKEQIAGNRPASTLC
ncbi:hypothetical protein [Pseudomonas sp. ML2-2023-3]|uniref:hypothetical protein n=1 Tax=Pseudomonas sp. ML2-2023-3 TaxID=3122375 RepID=UPI0030D0BBEA